MLNTGELFLNTHCWVYLFAVSVLPTITGCSSHIKQQFCNEKHEHFNKLLLISLCVHMLGTLLRTVQSYQYRFATLLPHFQQILATSVLKMQNSQSVAFSICIMYLLSHYTWHSSSFGAISVHALFLEYKAKESKGLYSICDR